MRAFSWSLLACGVFGAGTLTAQSQPETAGFVVRLGNDTVAVERFTRSGGRLEGDLVARVPRTRRFHYVATLAANGTVSRFESSMWPGAALSGAPQFRTVASLTGDSAVVELHSGDSVRTFRMAAARGAVPLVAGTSFALYEQGIRQALASHRDSLPLDLIFIGSREASGTFITRIGRDSVAIGFFGLPYKAKVDQAGRLLGLDGSETTQKFLVERIRDADVAGLAQRFAAGDAAGHALGQLSPRDTVRASLAGAHLLVDYGRPHRRGRTIFGGIVPWGEVWRTGANAATQFSTDRDLVVAGTPVPAGNYTLWTLPAPSGTKLIINQQTGQWGTDYDAAQDLAQVAMTSETLPAPVEQFTITIEPAAAGGVLRLAWDTVQLSVPIQVKPKT